MMEEEDEVQNVFTHTDYMSDERYFSESILSSDCTGETSM